MKIPFRIKKSAGITVSAQVHRLIVRGDRARGNDWGAAADAYAEALASDPSLYHIQIQLGHAAKEAGRFDQAADAYRSAAGLRPLSGEAYLHLAHMAKRQGPPGQAKQAFADAARRSDTAAEAIRELRELIAPVIRLDSDTLLRLLTEPEATLVTTNPVSHEFAVTTNMAAALSTLAGTLDSAANRTALEQASERLLQLDQQQEPGNIVSVVADRPLVFDLTDLVAHFRNHRLPTGIQRVQIEVLATALRTQGRDRVHICCFIDGRDHWIGIPIDRFLTLAHLASASSDGAEMAWMDAQARLFLGLAMDPYMVMPDRAMLVNLGTSWWIHDYFRLIRTEKDRAGISYVPFVHDWIPLMVPEHVVRGVTMDFVSWAVGVFAHADAFLVNSTSTGTDLRRVAERLGHDVDERRIEVVPLDADFQRLSSQRLPDAELRRWGLADEPYALFVSTIESRKNHVLAFEGWAELLRRHGRAKVPRLVCVGRDGWLNDRAFAKLNASAELRAAVTVIHQVSDEELALLYRCCQFTIYPSHYEGWGLPITESLCYGRIPVVANNSSLPEAGAGHAILFDSNSLPAFVRAVEQVAFDAEERSAREAAIAQHYRPRPWARIAGQINAALARFSALDGDRSRAVERPVRSGLYYPMGLYMGARIWRGLASGEIFRAGEGWLWPEVAGCRTRPAGGELRMTIAESPAAYRLYVRLGGLADATCPFTISIGGQPVIKGVLGVGEDRWASGDLPEDCGPDLAIVVQGHATETVIMSTGGSDKRLQAGPTVIGFGLCRTTDEEQRASFVAAAAWGDLDTINAYGERPVPSAPAAANG